MHGNINAHGGKLKEVKGSTVGDWSNEGMCLWIGIAHSYWILFYVYIYIIKSLSASKYLWYIKREKQIQNNIYPIIPFLKIST